MMRAVLATGLALWGGMAAADGPRVVVDITPMQSLVAMVMQDHGQIDTIVERGQSPHGVTLRPSQARAMDKADLVIWVGPELTPWMVDPLAALAGETSTLALLAAEGGVRMEYRDGHDDHDDHGQDDHDDHAHDDHAHDDHGHDDHDDHAHDDHGHDDHGHSHEGIDPHAWLDPVTAQAWLPSIVTALSSIDPDHASVYAANAEAASAELAALSAEITEQLKPYHDVPFVTFHDAYQYFENRFDLSWVGSVSPSDASDPSAAELAELRDQIKALGVTCALSEVQFNDRLLEAAGGSDLRIVEIDPLGATLEPGAALYPELIRNMAAGMAECMGS